MQRENKKKRRIRPVYLGFLGVLFTAAILLNIIYLLYSTYNAKKLDETERSRILNQTVYYSDRFVEELENNSNMLSIASSVQKLTAYRIKKDYLDYMDCMEVLSKYEMTSPEIYRIDLYVKNYNTLVTSSEGVFYDLSEEESHVYEKYLECEEEWFWDVAYRGREPELVNKTRNDKYIAFVKPIVSLYTGKKAGAICISVKLSDLQALMPMENSLEEGICMTCQGQPLFGTVPEDKALHVLSRTSDYSGMKYEYYYVPRVAEAITLQFLAAISLITMLFIAVFLGIVFVSERRMFEPAHILLKGFCDVEEGRFQVRLDAKRNDVFGELFDGFNHMAGSLEHMIEELSNERTRRNEFKFRLLQMQIKPHFLYNLFNNMVWMMEQKDYERLGILIQSTAGYYKTALNYGNQDIMLIDNQKQLEYYVEIQKIRFGDTFTFRVDFPEEVQLYSIPNLLLQPLVENSIIHGLKGKKEICHIHVYACQREEMLELAVDDDGCGIAEEMLEDIHNEMKRYEGDGNRYFALINITARLHNRYKERADIRIESEMGRGTRVVMRIPLDEVR